MAIIKTELRNIKYILLIIIGINAYSQQNDDFKEIDSIARNVKFESRKLLADDITEHCKTDLEKVRAIYIWLSHNISYDFEVFENPKLKDEIYTTIDKTIDRILERKKAICGGYSVLFKELCENSEIECVTINGIGREYSDNEEKTDKTNHTWNAVKINDKWHLVDLTWTNTIIDIETKLTIFDDFWFLTKPEYFFYSHYPTSDEKWTLLDRKYSLDDFYKLPNIKNTDYFKELKPEK